MLRRDIKHRPIPCKVSRTQPLIRTMSAPTRPPVVRVEPLGQSFEAPDSLTILEAAAFANLRLPRSCRNGTCRTCLCRMKSGRVRYSIDWPGVSREEKAEGYILPCVAIAETDVVIEVQDAVLIPAR
ncbi:ferredoxin [Burkholderia sp. H160]|nr:ferredoxin [Burkholderia sp. H160]